MTDLSTRTIDRPPAAWAAVSRVRTKSRTVSASALALHLDCSRTYVGKLEAEGVLHRGPDGVGFDPDASLRLPAVPAARAAPPPVAHETLRMVARA